jgi:hypothetical protein
MTTILKTATMTITAECLGRRGIHEILIEFVPTDPGETKRTTSFLCGDHNAEDAKIKLEKIIHLAEGNGDGSQSIRLQSEEAEGMCHERFDISFSGSEVKLTYDAEVFDMNDNSLLFESHCGFRADRKSVAKMAGKLLDILRKCCSYDH